MKRFLILALFSILAFSVSNAFDKPPRSPQNHPRNNFRSCFIKSQISRTSVRMPEKYTILGWKNIGVSNVALTFMCSGSFLITISDTDNVLVYNYQLTLPSNSEKHDMVIPTHSFKRGIYTMTIEDTNSGESASGDFAIE